MREKLDYQYREGLKRIELNTHSELPEILPSAEKIILQIGGKKGESIDLGALCYSKREPFNESGYWGKTGKKVELNSLEACRVEFITHLITYLLESKLALKSKKSVVGTFQSFIGFCDGKEQSSEMFCKKNGFEVFIRYLMACTQTKKTIIWDVFCEYFEKEGLIGQLPLQHWYEQNRRSPTQPLLDDQVRAIVNFNNCIFNAGYDLLLNMAEFPYQFEVPEVVKEPSNHYALLPLRFQRHKRQQRIQNSVPTFNFVKRDWVSESDLLKQGLKLKKHSQVVNRIKKDKTYVDEANKDPVHWARIYFAELAMAAYRNLFMLLTASNETGLREFQDFNDVPWGEDYEQKNFAKNYWKFSYKKGRASHKKVEFKLIKEDSLQFSKYLKLRRALIQAYGKKETDCNYLFFRYNKNEFKMFKQTKQFFEFFPEIAHINSQIARATKSDILMHSTSNIGLISNLLQNDFQTVLKNYARGTVRGHITEVGGFLQNVSEVVSEKRTVSEVESEVGNCDAFNEPKAIVDIPITMNQPDCSSKEGCLFCDKYRNHGDEKDVRKLLSYLYFIEDAEIGLSETRHFEMFFKLVIDRVKDILNFIKSQSEEQESLVVRLEEEVFDRGELSDFFEQELDLRERINETWSN